MDQRESRELNGFKFPVNLQPKLNVPPIEDCDFAHAHSFERKKLTGPVEQIRMAR